LKKLPICFKSTVGKSLESRFLGSDITNSELQYYIETLDRSLHALEVEFCKINHDSNCEDSAVCH